MFQETKFSEQPNERRPADSIDNERGRQGNERIGQAIHTLATQIYAAQANRQVIKLQLRGTLRPVQLLVDTGAEVSVIKHECLDVPNCKGKKDHNIFVIIGNDKINMLGTSQLEMKNKQVEFLMAKMIFLLIWMG